MSHMSRWSATAAVVVSVLAFADGPGGQGAPRTLLESHAQARAVIDAAAAAHGGPAALEALQRVRVVLDGDQFWRYQSRRVDPPYDRARERAEFIMDLPNNRLVSARWQTYPGGAHRQTGFITDGAAGFSVDFRRGTHQVREWPPVTEQTGYLHNLPVFVVRDLAAGARTLRSLGRHRLESGAEIDVVAGLAGTTLLTAGFDPQTRLLRALFNVSSELFGGEAATEIEFLDYDRQDGIPMPGRYVVRNNGVILRDQRFTIEPGYAIPADRLRPPAGSRDTTKDPSTEAVRTIAPGVWAIGGGTASLAVAFSDHVVVIDALNNAPDVLTRLAALAPNKPVRYVIPTHHHDDHAGGLRHYVRAGAAIVTTAANRAFMERLGRAGGTPRVDVLTAASRVFADATQRLEVHLLTGNPHAEENLVAWLPSPGVLFQGDLIDVGSSGAIPPGTNNETTMHFADWLTSKGWKVRTYGGTHGFLPSPETFESLVRQPLLPQRFDDWSAASVPAAGREFRSTGR